MLPPLCAMYHAEQFGGGAKTVHVVLSWTNHICHGTLVLSCTPCHVFIKSPRTALTIRCCLSMVAPRNFSELISIPYIDPQPPDMSCTTSSTGLNSLARRSQTSDSASLRKSGFSSILEGLVDSAGAALTSGGAEEEYRLRVLDGRAVVGYLGTDRGAHGAVDVEV